MLFPSNETTPLHTCVCVGGFGETIHMVGFLTFYNIYVVMKTTGFPEFAGCLWNISIQSTLDILTPVIGGNNHFGQSPISEFSQRFPVGFPRPQHINLCKCVVYRYLNILDIICRGEKLCIRSVVQKNYCCLRNEKRSDIAS